MVRKDEDEGEEEEGEQEEKFQSDPKSAMERAFLGFNGAEAAALRRFV